MNRVTASGERRSLRQTPKLVDFATSTRAALILYIQHDLEYISLSKDFNRAVYKRSSSPCGPVSASFEVEPPTPKVVRYGRGTTFFPGDNREGVPHQSPFCARAAGPFAWSVGPRSHAILNERGRKTERSREGSVTRLPTAVLLKTAGC